MTFLQVSQRQIVLSPLTLHLTSLFHLACFGWHSIRNSCTGHFSSLFKTEHLLYFIFHPVKHQEVKWKLQDKLKLP